MDEHRCKIGGERMVSTGIFADGFDRLNHRRLFRCLSLSKAPCHKSLSKALLDKFGDFDGIWQNKFWDFVTILLFKL